MPAFLLTELTSEMDTVQWLAWSYSTETKWLSFRTPHTACVYLNSWKGSLHQLIWIYMYMKMYLEEVPSLSWIVHSKKYSESKNSVVPAIPVCCLLLVVSSPAPFCIEVPLLSSLLPSALCKSPSWERSGTQTIAHSPYVSGMPICFCSGFSPDKTGWRALAQRTSLRIALDNPLNRWLINLYKK